jgi:hypothetical protein
VAQSIARKLKTPQGEYRPSQSVFIETIIVSRSAYKRTPGWDIRIDTGEDTQFVSDLNQPGNKYKYTRRPLIKRVDRLNDRGWLGERSQRQKLKNIEWEDIGISFVIATRNMNNGTVLSPDKFALKYWGMLNSLKELTPEEILILDDFKKHIKDDVYDDNPIRSYATVKTNISLYKLIILGRELENRLNENINNAEKYKNLLSFYSNFGSLLIDEQKRLYEEERKRFS